MWPKDGERCREEGEKRKMTKQMIEEKEKS
jgi:hypothetical protein